MQRTPLPDSPAVNGSGARETVSVIVPVHNKTQYLAACLSSIVAQSYDSIEVSIFDDASHDQSLHVIANWIWRILARGYSLVISSHHNCRRPIRFAPNSQSRNAADDSQTVIRHPLLCDPPPVTESTPSANSDSAEVEGMILQSALDQSFLVPASPETFEARGELLISLLITAGAAAETSSNERRPVKARGVGFAKNRAVEQSAGRFLCYLDADDFMFPNRVELQLEAALQRPRAIIGSQFLRLPLEATPRYHKWLNYSIVNHNPQTQPQYESDDVVGTVWTQRFRECTLVHPTWFYSRAVYDEALRERASTANEQTLDDNAIGAYDETLYSPEDMMFLYAHTRRRLFAVAGEVATADDAEGNQSSGGLCFESVCTALRTFDWSSVLYRVDKPLVVYRYGSGVSLGIPRRQILDLRVAELQRQFLDFVPPISECGTQQQHQQSTARRPKRQQTPPIEETRGGFMIWGCGRDGRELYSRLDAANQSKLVAFLDVDAKKLARAEYVHYTTKQRIPIIAPLADGEGQLASSAAMTDSEDWRLVRAPVVLCVKADLTGGQFEANVRALLRRHSDWVEGIHYVYFC